MDLSCPFLLLSTPKCLPPSNQLFFPLIFSIYLIFQINQHQMIFLLRHLKCPWATIHLKNVIGLQSCYTTTHLVASVSLCGYKRVSLCEWQWDCLSWNRHGLEGQSGFHLCFTSFRWPRARGSDPARGLPSQSSAPLCPFLAPWFQGSSLATVSFNCLIKNMTKIPALAIYVVVRLNYEMEALRFRACYGVTEKRSVTVDTRSLKEGNTMAVILWSLNNVTEHFSPSSCPLQGPRKMWPSSGVRL